MRKYKLSEIKNLVREGFAVDLTTAHADSIPAQYEKIGYSSGTYGINGGVIKDTENGTYYAITARNSMLFRIF